MPPFSIIQMAFAQRANQVLKAAVELNVFQPMAQGPASAQAVAQACQAPVLGIQRLLNVLVSMQLLTHQNHAYSLTDESRTYLLKDSLLCAHDFILGMPAEQAAWDSLSTAIRQGQSFNQLNQPQQAEAFFPRLAQNIFPLSYTTAQLLAQVLNVSSWPADSQVLDVGAGAGSWSIPLAEANLGVRVEALDLQAVLQVTQQFAQRHQVHQQYTYTNSTWQNFAWPTHTYTAITLGHVLHCEGEEASQQLLNHCFKALKPGGTVIIGEFIADEDSPGPLPVMLFDLHMYLNTQNGVVFSASQLIQLLSNAGFLNAQRLSLPYFQQQSPVVLAIKP